MKKPELLAPAGDMESLIAAVKAGCDAVYIGGKSFGARSFAGNFSDSEIIESIAYAHLYGVKVYVTMNTVVYENEVSAFLAFGNFLYQNHVDAVIIQDIGMMDLIHQTIPNLEIHASTQMHIHNLEGVQLVESLGVQRAVLARETEIELIREIKTKTDLPLEIFVHGALCMSYSGQCLMSSLIGGRSGNRGTCAGSCRQKYDLVVKENDTLTKVNKDEYLLSLKDLNTLEYLGELIDLGIDSFKIEGRMKRPEYVYAVVAIYRRAIDTYIKNGKVEIADLDLWNLKKLFNREFTKGFMFHEKNDQISNSFRPNHMGIEVGNVVEYDHGRMKIKLTENVRTGDGIRVIGDFDCGLTLTSFFQNQEKVKCAKKGDTIIVPIEEEVKVGSRVVKTTDKDQIDYITDQITQKRVVPISSEVTLEIGQPMKLTLTEGNYSVTVESDTLVQIAEKQPLTKERVIEQLSKLGNTVYEMEHCEVHGCENVFVVMKELNEIRRKATETLSEVRLSRSVQETGKYERDVPDFEPTKLETVLVETMAQYEMCKDKFDVIYVEESLLNQIDDSRVILKIPRVKTEYAPYSKPLLVGELGSIHHYSNTISDFSLNVTNSYSVALLHGLGCQRVTLSLELDQMGISQLVNAYQERYQKHPSLELIIFGHEEMMVSKYNLLEKYHVGDKLTYLKDRFDNIYPIRIKDGLMYLYHDQIRNLGNKETYFKMGINSVRYQLLNDTDFSFMTK